MSVKLGCTHLNRGNTPIAHLIIESGTWAEPRFSRPVDKELGEEGIWRGDLALQVCMRHV